ncbi:ABC transporter permease subunit [Actinomadura harenae]|uniref:ABC transporter permease n=1 Tax=Actinomadura harenae TaxID=2483351 RepID=A0A3M2MD50_9ACTN|nr:ABC transporter permease subunit [Actinomadura harenae]RMI47469.1 ABC transporter permease [Actinomadura harenae]
MTAPSLVPGRGVLRSEWIKLRSVRSTTVMVLFATLVAVVLGVLATSSDASGAATMTAQDRAQLDPLGDSFIGLIFGELAFGVLGVLAVSTEYRTGLIRTTFSAVPRRGRVYLAKALVVGAVSLLLGTLLAFGSFVLGQAMLSPEHLEVHLGDPGVLRAVLSAGLYLFAVTMIGFGLGAILRHGAAAIAALVALLWLTYPVGRILDHLSYLPSRMLLFNIADAITRAHPATGKPALRIPSLDLAYTGLALYLVVFLALGAWRISRDA